MKTSKNNFEDRLKGGHPNSLGNTIAIVDEVLASPAGFDQLFNCYFSEDEVVRLRTSNAMKRICKSRKSLLIPYIDRVLNEIAQIDQASIQWTLSQLFDMLEEDLSPDQKVRAKNIMMGNLANHHDWIVLNQTMTTLSKWVKKEDDLKICMLHHLRRLTKDPRKSVAAKARKVLASLNH